MGSGLRRAPFLRRLVAVVALATWACAPRPAAAEPQASRVIWTHGMQVYIAPSDSNAVLLGDRVWFVQNGEPLGSATVTRIDRDGLAFATLDSGSLADAKHLDRLEVQVTHRVIRTPARLVVGSASPRRLATAQPKLPALLAHKPAGYHLEATATNGYRLVRDTSLAATAWPETVLVRWFDVVVDEEIALERGEIDIGLFAPGELSGPMRERPRWQGYRCGIRNRDAMVWVAIDSITLAPMATRIPSRADSDRVSTWTREAYRGDLEALPLPGSAPGDSTAESLRWAEPPPAPRPTVATPRRYPGPPARGPRDSRARRANSTLRFLEAPIASFDSLAVALATQMSGPDYGPATRASADSTRLAILASASGAMPVTPWNRYVALHQSLGLISVHLLRCPILCPLELRSYVDALDAGALADLIGGLPSGGAR